MFQPIEDLPDGVIGFRAVGKVTADDYRTTLAPAVEQATAGGNKLRLLLELGPDFDGYDFGAMLSDAKIGMEEFNSFEKMAVVTDNGMFRSMIEMFARFMPGAVRVFGVADLDAARAWMGA